MNPAISEGSFHDISKGTNEDGRVTIDPAENHISSKVVTICYGPIFDISSVGVFITSVFVTAFYLAREVARARGGTEVRHPQCRSAAGGIPLGMKGHRLQSQRAK